MKDLTDPTNRDTVPAMLTPGETVVNKEASMMFGQQLQAMNNAGLQKRAAGNAMVYANDGKYILSDADKDQLIRMSIAEAGGESDEGIAGVMYTVLNRQKAGEKQWGGNKIKDIIHKNKNNKRYQFSSANPASSVYYWFKDDEVINTPEYAKSKAILEGMLKGDITDPTDGGHYFLKPELDYYDSNNRLEGKGYPMAWWQKTHGRKKIGSHVFARDDKVYGYENPNVYKSIKPMKRPESIRPMAREYIENSSLNVPNMEGIPMYANTGASSLQTLIQSLMKGNQSGGIPRHQVNQGIKNDQELLYGSSQSRSNILGGPGDPYGRQLQRYPSINEVDVHGFPHDPYSRLDSIEVTMPKEEKDLFEFYHGTRDSQNDSKGMNLQKIIDQNTNTISEMPGGIPTTDVTEVGKDSALGPIPRDDITSRQPTWLSENFPGLNEYYKSITQPIEVPEVLGGGDALGIAQTVAPANTELLSDMQNPYLHPESERYIDPTTQSPFELHRKPGESVMSSKDFLDAEEKNLSELMSKLNSLPADKLEDIQKVSNQIDESKRKILEYENINIRNAITGYGENKKVVDKALKERQRLLDSGKDENDPVIKKIDQYIENVKGVIPNVSDAFSTDNRRRWSQAKNGPIHGSAADMENRLENLAAKTGNPNMPGAEPEREDQFGPDPFGGAAATALSKMEEEKRKNPSKVDKMLKSAKGVVGAAFDDLFDAESLARAAMIYTAYRLTGASGNQAIKAAGEDYLTQVQYVNKKEIWDNHVKKLASYKVFTPASLELYARTQDTKDLVRYSDLNNINKGNETKEYWDMSVRGRPKKYIARSYTQGSSENKTTGWVTTIDGKDVIIDPTSSRWSDNSRDARDWNHPDFVTFNNQKQESFRNLVTDEINRQVYKEDYKVTVSGKDTKKERTKFLNLNAAQEAAKLAQFAWTYNLPDSTVAQIYQLAVAEAYAFKEKNSDAKITAIAGSDVDSAFMNSAWIKVNVGSDNLFMVDPGQDKKTFLKEKKPPVYDTPENISNTIREFQTFSIDNNYLFPQLYDKDLAQFSSVLLDKIVNIEDTVEDKAGADVLPDWNTWSKTFVTKESREYEGSDSGSSKLAQSIETWRDDWGNNEHAGKSEFLKFLHFYMYSLRTMYNQ